MRPVLGPLAEPGSALRQFINENGPNYTLYYWVYWAR